jgi:hypothetical protein
LFVSSFSGRFFGPDWRSGNFWDNRFGDRLSRDD